MDGVEFALLNSGANPPPRRSFIMMTLILLTLQADHPLTKDKTGMAWVMPFTEARARAAKEKRLLLIKPVAFGTSADGGW